MDNDCNANVSDGGYTQLQMPLGVPDGFSMLATRSASDPSSWATVKGLVFCDASAILAEVASLDVAAEVCCVEPGVQHGSWAGLPLPHSIEEEGFILRPLPGFIWPATTERIVPVPHKETHALLGLTPEDITNEIFVEVRYALRPSALQNFHFDDVRDGILRLFVVPDDEAREHRIFAVAEEDSVEKALAASRSREQARLINFLHSAAAPPERWASTTDSQSVEAEEEELDRKPAEGSGLFPHQVASVNWMMEAEREECVQARTVTFANQTWGAEYEVELPAGGVLAHPPGAGKTRIVASFVSLKPAPTTILCPPHLAEFWRNELSTQGGTATVLPFGSDLDDPGRLVIDEPQDLTHAERIRARAAASRAASLWIICGTPQANRHLLGELLLGRPRAHFASTSSEYIGEPVWPYIFQKRYLADPPAVCLPRPELDVVEVSVNPGVEGIDAAVAGLSGYLMDQMVHLTFGRAATELIMERARSLEDMGFAVHDCHEITLADWDVAVKQRSDRRAAAVANRLVALEAEMAEQEQVFANRDDLDALRDVPVILHVNDMGVEAAPAEWNAFWAGQTLEATIGEGALVSRESDCAGCCRRNPSAVLAIFIADEAMPIGYAPNEGAPPMPAVRIAARHAGRLLHGARVTLEVRRVGIIEDEIGNISSEIARDAVEMSIMHEVQQLRMEKASLERAKRFAAEVRESLGSRTSTSCPICFEDHTTVAILPDCSHAFCRGCFERTVGLSGDPGGAFGCPICRCPSLRRDVVIFRHDGGEDALPQKLVRLVELLRDLQDEKVLIFVQWASTLPYLRKMLGEHGIPALALEGDLPTTMDALRRFSRPGDSESSANVLLLSFQRHASGINLQFCRHVIILHPYCPETASDLAFVSMRDVRGYETQAVGRVRRYPQTNVVRVYRIFAACSVEEEIYSTAWNR